MIDLNKILEAFIKIEKPSIIKKLTGKNEIRKELEDRALIGQSIKNMMKMPAWELFLIPKLTENLKSEMAKLMRHEALSMSESELKTIISALRQNLSFVAEIKYALEEGERAQEKLQK